MLASPVCLLYIDAMIVYVIKSTDAAVVDIIWINALISHTAIAYVLLDSIKLYDNLTIHVSLEISLRDKNDLKHSDIPVLYMTTMIRVNMFICITVVRIAKTSSSVAHTSVFKIVEEEEDEEEAKKK
uniref:Uncharacterized protein n=1 Tax=Glossina pallidipes TaxID=7398 RepID=A0A1B0A2W0_GLOPL